MTIAFLKGRIGSAVGSDAEVPVSNDDPLPVSLVTAAGGTPAPVTPSASATTGGVPNNFRLPSSAASNNAAFIKAAQGQVYYIVAYNSNAAVRFLKLFNKATVPTPGVDIPVISLPIPPNGGIAIEVGLGTNLFPAGIAFALTAGAADSDNTAVGAADILGVNIGYA